MASTSSNDKNMGCLLELVGLPLCVIFFFIMIGCFADDEVGSGWGVFWGVISGLFLFMVVKGHKLRRRAARTNERADVPSTTWTQPVATTPRQVKKIPVKCKTCGAENEVPVGGSEKCAYCDSTLEHEKSTSAASNSPQEVEAQTPVKLGADEMFCESCGGVIKKEAEICVKCGVRVY